jgi:hypothetical protein
MNWAGLLVALSAIALAFYTMPWGLLILAFMAWVWSRS